MKTLYFDIDGTILVEDRNVVKSDLGGGKFESAVKTAGFEKLVCVGNFGGIARAIKDLGVEYDELGVLFNLCGGAFLDEAWLRSNTVLLDDPQNRADHIEFTGNWWYVDDLAGYYMERAGKSALFLDSRVSRICAPDPNGSGCDVLEWLRGSAAQ